MELDDTSHWIESHRSNHCSLGSNSNKTHSNRPRRNEQLCQMNEIKRCETKYGRLPKASSLFNPRPAGCLDFLRHAGAGRGGGVEKPCQLDSQASQRDTEKFVRKLVRNNYEIMSVNFSAKVNIEVTKGHQRPNLAKNQDFQENAPLSQKLFWVGGRGKSIRQLLSRSFDKLPSDFS